MWSAVARREKPVDWLINVIANNGGIYYLPKGFMDELHTTPQHEAIRALVNSGGYRIERGYSSHDAVVEVRR